MYLYFLISAGSLGTIKCLTLFHPTLIQSLINPPALVHLLIAPPYIIACLCCWLGGFSSSRRNEHGFHITISLSVGLLGFILMIIFAGRNTIAIYIGSCIACCGLYTSFPLALAWLTKNVSGQTKRTLAICIFMASGQLGGAISSQVSVVPSKYCL